MRLLRLVAAMVVAASILGHAQMPGQGIAVSKDNRSIAITATDSVIVMAMWPQCISGSRCMGGSRYGVCGWLEASNAIMSR